MRSWQGGAYGWQTRASIPTSDSYLASSGWSLGWNAQVGMEYYLRPRVAFDVGLHWHDTHLEGAAAGLTSNHLRFTSLWIGHYVRF